MLHRARSGSQCLTITFMIASPTSGSSNRRNSGGTSFSVGNDTRTLLGALVSSPPTLAMIRRAVPSSG